MVYPYRSVAKTINWHSHGGNNKSEYMKAFGNVNNIVN